MWSRGLESSSGHENGTSFSRKDEEFLVQVSKYQFLKKGFLSIELVIKHCSS
jgi:hypothetical protein